MLQAQKSNNETLLKWDCDWNDLIEKNLHYINGSDKHDKSNLLSIISPADRGSGVLLSASDIIELLNDKNIKHNLTPEKVGRSLKQHGYSQGRQGNYKGYWVSIK